MLGEYNRWEVVGIIMLFITVAIFIGFFSSSRRISSIETWIGIGTFLLATAYGFWGLISNRTNQLDKVITVHFMIKGGEETENKKWINLFTCHKFSLAMESDIRAVSQQIGSQMARENRLKFTPNYDQKPPVEIRYKHKDVIHYEVTFYLTQRPILFTNIDNVHWWWNDKTKEAERIRNAAVNKEDLQLRPRLINLSNHSLNEEQRLDAYKLIDLEKHRLEKHAIKFKSESNEIIEIEFPAIHPEWKMKRLLEEVDEYYKKILAQSPLLVTINGESTFCYRLIQKLDFAGIKCYTSTTKRDVVLEGNTKLSIFKHVQFRPYT